MSSSLLVLYYFQGELGESLEYPNAFIIQNSPKNIKFQEFLDKFPNTLNASYHFRFRVEDKSNGYLWMDVQDFDTELPIFDGKIVAKILKLDDIPTARRTLRLKIKKNLSSSTAQSTKINTDFLSSTLDDDQVYVSSSSSSLSSSSTTNINTSTSTNTTINSPSVNGRERMPGDSSTTSLPPKPPRPRQTDSKPIEEQESRSIPIQPLSSSKINNVPSTSAKPLSQTTDDLLDYADDSGPVRKTTASTSSSSSLSSTTASPSKPLTATTSSTSTTTSSAPKSSQSSQAAANEDILFDFTEPPPPSTSTQTTKPIPNPLTSSGSSLKKGSASPVSGSTTTSTPTSASTTATAPAAAVSNVHMDIDDDNAKKHPMSWSDGLKAPTVSKEQAEMMELDEARAKHDKTLQAWAYNLKDKRNIRTLLSTLHNVLWPGNSWKQVGLGDILDAKQVKLQYRKAMLIVHPDRLSNQSVEVRYLGKRIFEAINEAYQEFLKKESV